MSTSKINKKTEKRSNETAEQTAVLPKPYDRKLRLTKRDRLYLIILTAIYTVVALFNLGSLLSPETAWKAEDGETAMIVFDEPANVAYIKVHCGIYTGKMELTPIGTNVSSAPIEYQEKDVNMFRWHTIYSSADEKNDPVDGYSVAISSTGGSAYNRKFWLNEIAFLDADCNPIPFTVSGNEAAISIGDEQNTVGRYDSPLYGMYFDELYHARTAYEHLNGIAPYENSHPPLGKIIISLGIAIFGMNPFGWRIMGALFGAAMVPIMYCFGKRLFGKSDFALLLASVFAFDFMHFTQTRIATIDVYGVFFIILMFYYMYQYYCMNFFVDGLKNTLKPLGLAGLFFGLGAASKWICIYAGGGLAVILAISLVQRYIEYKKCQKHGTDEEKQLTAKYWPTVIKTLLWCCVFYIAIPVAIYITSYLPYYLSEAKYSVFGSENSMWSTQQFMLRYHSQLTAEHPYQSDWWEWPLVMRPVWYYIGRQTASGGQSTISVFGNPAVWCVCAVGTVWLIIRLLRGKMKNEKGITVAFIGILCNYVPWMFVTRSVYIYHYFATVVFVLICTVYLFKNLEESGVFGKNIKWIWLGVVLLFFVVFYPVIAGAEVPVSYIKALEWGRRWTFLGETPLTLEQMFGAIFGG